MTEMAFEELVNLIVNNGLGIIAVCYLIYFQHTTMREMLSALAAINTRLTTIEAKIEEKNNEA